MNKKIKIFAVVLLLNAGILSAQNEFQNTLPFDSSLVSPAATLQDVAWVAGHWTGEAFGGITEEVWTAPLGGSMMCAFKLVVDGKIKFYELCTITEENNSLILKIKHFNSDLKGWEDKDKSAEFPLVKITKNRVYFDEFTFEKISADDINIYVVIKQKNGQQEEVKFNYTKKM
jgi:hypothetical protein